MGSVLKLESKRITFEILVMSHKEKRRVRFSTISKASMILENIHEQNDENNIGRDRDSKDHCDRILNRKEHVI